MRDPLRPDPDALLGRVQAQEARAGHGRLRIFFGAAPGVGKTYAMLQAARAARERGADVVVGVVETHKRADTERLLEGLEVLPRRPVEYRGSSLPEFDLDGALERRPALLLVDELAHTNAPGSRHEKRWQDVMELVEAGIDVWTTLNVQHLEGLHDVVESVTSVAVRERIPDAVFDRADEIEVVDLTPDDLVQRLKEGRVYLPESATRALENFFRKGNLIALRELALRRAAERVDAQMLDYREDAGIRPSWPVRRRLLVAVSTSAGSMNLVRATHRLASEWRAPWMAVTVETPGSRHRSEDDRRQVAETLRTAEALGADVLVLTGSDAAEEVLHCARARNVSTIVVGRSKEPRWRRWLRPRVPDRLLDEARGVEVLVTGNDEAPERSDARSGDAPRAAGAPGGTEAGRAARRKQARGLLNAVVGVSVATLLCVVAGQFVSLNELVMMYLVVVVWMGLRHGRSAAFLASVLSTAAFDFFFVPPAFTFAVTDFRFIAITFPVMLATGLLVGTLTGRVREQAERARQREHETGLLYELTRKLAAVQDEGALLERAAGTLRDLLGGDVAVLAPDSRGDVVVRAEAGDPFAGSMRELAVGRWTFANQEPAGVGTSVLPGAIAVYVPVRASNRTIAVLAWKGQGGEDSPGTDAVGNLRAYAGQIGQALERLQLARVARQAQVAAEAEQVRGILLSSVSHDLRTPLAAITGAASGLLESGAPLDAAQTREMLQTIGEEAGRLNRRLRNILDMTRVQGGALALDLDWHSLEEIIGSVLSSLRGRLEGRATTVDFPPDLPLVFVDASLFEQLFVNLLENAVKYTPHGSPIEIGGERGGAGVVVTVADRGPGFAPGEEMEVFEKFRRGSAARGSGGTGLGLAIARAIAEAHGGAITAFNRLGGGAILRVEFPVGSAAPPGPPPDLAGSPGAPEEPAPAGAEPPARGRGLAS